MLVTPSGSCVCAGRHNKYKQLASLILHGLQHPGADHQHHHHCVINKVLIQGTFPHRSDIYVGARSTGLFLVFNKIQHVSHQDVTGVCSICDASVRGLQDEGKTGYPPCCLGCQRGSTVAGVRSGMPSDGLTGTDMYVARIGSHDSVTAYTPARDATVCQEKKAVSNDLLYASCSFLLLLCLTIQHCTIQCHSKQRHARRYYQSQLLKYLMYYTYYHYHWVDAPLGAQRRLLTLALTQDCMSLGQILLLLLI